ncbi:hypothetical protein NA8A_18402 [Nitratireductor indicus C115]|uniref:Surface lipoprotein assembly modifier C-terminal domain-containing protein n=1 Tax=Nitratireductor indicus C115 TaxID=1231190 RepID=K2NN92_9HYPH|nr:hypothetical protein NA8A_18402 [Nitratireductor indicus C115]SFQ33063.1 Tetratricopeptide repeat-containing protein [Nitratireductor indicus]
MISGSMHEKACAPSREGTGLFSVRVSSLRSLFLAALMCLGAITGPAVSAPAAEGGSTAIVSSAQAVATVRSLVDAGRFEEARGFIARWNAGSRSHSMRVAFVEGLIAARSGRHAQAAAIFREILAVDPQNDVARIELARSLAALNDADGVRAQAELLRASGIDDRLGGAITRLADLVDAGRPLRFRGYLSLLPSTNINRGTDNETVAFGPIDLRINPDARRKSGIGLLLGGEMIYQKPLSPTRRLISVTSATGRFYPKLPSASSLQVDGALGVEQRIGSTRAMVALTGSIVVTPDAVTTVQTGIRGELSGRFAAAPRWFWYLGGQARIQDDLVSDARDGYVANLGFNLDRMFATGHFIRFGVRGELARLREGRFSYDEAGLLVGYARPLPLGINVFAQAALSWRDYHGLYPGLDEGQSDIRFTGDIIATKRDLHIAGFAPQLQYRFERVSSNAAFEDYTRHEVELRLTKDF